MACCEISFKAGDANQLASWLSGRPAGLTSIGRWNHMTPIVTTASICLQIREEISSVAGHISSCPYIQSFNKPRNMGGTSASSMNVLLLRSPLFAFSGMITACEVPAVLGSGLGIGCRLSEVGVRCSAVCTFRGRSTRVNESQHRWCNPKTRPRRMSQATIVRSHISRSLQNVWDGT